MPRPPADADWLTAAARLGLRGRPSSVPNPSVGAIIVKDGRVIGRGWTGPGGRPHGERMALDQAGVTAKGATIYTTLEPCAHVSQRGPACASSIVEAGLSRVVYGVRDPDPRTLGKGAAMLERGGVAVTRLISEACEESLCGYLFKCRYGRPYVTLKLATSMDGFIARPDGESRWITGEAARAHVHSRRALADAILVGGNTWRRDTPALDVRLPGLELRKPRRVVLSRNVSDGIETIRSPTRINELERVQYLYVEGGGETAASFLSADLVDRIEWYRAPILIGNGIPALRDHGLDRLSDAHGRWRLAERRILGNDSYEAYDRTTDPTVLPQ